MTANSIAKRAVESLPATAAPPSFDGLGWLYALNLTVFTAGFYLLLMLAGWLWFEMRKYRGQDKPSDPINVWRRVGFLISVGFCLRCGAEAFNLWAWDTTDPTATSNALQAKRFLDPIGAAFGFAGVATFALSLRGMTWQLRRQPFPVNMWASLPMMKRPAAIVALTLFASIGVVWTR